VPSYMLENRDFSPNTTGGCAEDKLFCS
jgi:hypothetical protein